MKILFQLLFFIVISQEVLGDCSLGNYSDTSITADGNINIIPSEAPSGSQFLSIKAPNNFQGILSINTVTGIIKITNAYPVGVFTITVSIGTCASSSFILSVNKNNCSSGNFIPNDTSIATGLNPYDLSIGDFNNDNNQDILSANVGTNSASIMFGNGHGSFSGHYTTSAVGASPISAAVGDFNSDGNDDFVTSNYSSSSVSVLLGNGTGNFNIASTIPVGLNPRDVEIGDFNNDGISDIATANYGANNVSIRIGDGLGNFTGNITIGVGLRPFLLQVGDFNNDSNLDIATANSGSSSVSILMGNGTGNFNVTSSVPVGSTPRSIAVGDFNHDNILDFATANFNVNRLVSIRLGDGTGNFYGTTEVPVSGPPQTVVVADFNGDNNQDFAVGYFGSFSIRFGDGLGNFFGTGFIAATGSGYFTVGDFNEDSIADISITINNDVAFFLGFESEINLTGNGINIPNGNTNVSTNDNTNFNSTSICNPISKTYRIHNAGPGPIDITSISIDGINAQDFSITNAPSMLINKDDSTSFTITFHPSLQGDKFATVHIKSTDCDESDYNFNIHGTGILPVLGNYPDTVMNLYQNISILPSTAPIGPTVLNTSVSGNFKGILFADPITGILHITNASPAGSYTISVSVGGCTIKSFNLIVKDAICSSGNFSLSSSLSTGANPYSVEVGDFNNDGKQDIVMSNYNSNNVTIRMGDGVGNFNLSNNFPVGLQPYDLAISDINGDGKQDIVTANFNANSISLLIGDGLGNFNNRTDFSVGSKPSALVIGDFNSDLFQDVAVTDNNENKIAILFGNGLGNFQAPNYVYVNSSSTDLAIGDFNNDTHLDLAVLFFQASKVDILIGDGLGNFSATTITVGNHPISIRTGDVNNDGFLDIATSNNGSNTVSILLGNGIGNFSGSTFITVSSNPYSLVINDFNGDGNLDLATSSNTANTVSIRLGNGMGNFTGTNNIAVGTNPRSLTAGDFNSDGRADLITGNYTQNTNSILLGIFNDVEVFGNSINILDGSDNVSLSNNTDYGNSGLCDLIIKNFLIKNSGTIPLTISGVTISGPNASDFQITTLPSASVNAGASTMLVITFHPTSIGIKTASVHISNNDCDESDYDFAIQGTGINGSVISYPDTLVETNGNISVTPNAVPSGASTITVTASPGFLGTLSVNATTGKIQVNNANPVGSYLVTVTIGPCGTTTFTLTIEDPCPVLTSCPGNLNISAPQGTCHTSVSYIVTSTGVPTPIYSYIFLGATTGSGCGTGSGSEFNSGTTHVEVMASNTCSTVICNFDVFVSTNTNDNNVCTIDGCDTVLGPTHVLLPIEDDHNACTIDACDPVLGVTHTLINIDDQDVCTADACDSVTGTSHTAIDIEDHNACTIDACDPITGVSHVLIGVDDHNPCTIDECNTETGLVIHTDETPSVTATPGNIACYGGTTCVTVSATGGQVPYFGTDEFCGYTAGEYVFGITDGKGCTATTFVTISEPTKLFLNTSSTPSTGLDGTATATVSGGTPGYTYFWLPDGQTTNPAIGLEAGTYDVSVTDANDCVVSSSVIVSEACNFDAPQLINGANGACRKQTGVEYCVDADPFALSYIWTLPTGVTSVGPMNGQCITISFSSKFKGGFICVKKNTACGISAATCKNISLVNKKPHTPGSVSGPAALCPDITTTYSTPLVSTATGYLWTVTGNISILSGQGINSITVKTASNWNGGSVKVKAINCKGSSGKRNKNISKTSGCRIDIGDGENKSGISSESFSYLSVYPNPNSGKATIKFVTSNSGIYILRILNILGSELLSENLRVIKGDNIKEINLGICPAGIYIISIQNEEGEKSMIKMSIE